MPVVCSRATGKPRSDARWHGESGRVHAWRVEAGNGRLGPAWHCSDWCGTAGCGRSRRAWRVRSGTVRVRLGADWKGRRVQSWFGWCVVDRHGGVRQAGLGKAGNVQDRNGWQAGRVMARFGAACLGAAGMAGLVVSGPERLGSAGKASQCKGRLASPEWLGRHGADSGREPVAWQARRGMARRGSGRHGSEGFGNT